MATYTAPTTRASGYLVTAANWNTDIVENIKYFKDAPTFDGAVTASSTLTAADNVGLAATKKLYLDGVALTGDTYLTESSANVLSLFSGNVEAKLTSGVLTVSGFGTHSFSAGGTGGNRFLVRNTTAGTGNFASVDIGNDASASAGLLVVTSSSFTPSGSYLADALIVESTRGGGLSVAASHASGAIRFYSGGTTERARFDTSGNLLLNTTTALAKFSLYVPMQSQDGAAFVDTSTAFSPNIYIHFYNSSLGVAGSIAHPSASAVTFNTSSDQRLKRDLGFATDVSALRALRIHDFSWTSDGVIDRNVFAQEAYAVMPRGITKGDDDPVTVTKTWMVEKAAYVPDLIVGWQQHDATIQSLAARIAALESK